MCIQLRNFMDVPMLPTPVNYLHPWDNPRFFTVAPGTERLY